MLRKLWRAAKVVWVFAWNLLKLLVIRPRTRPERAAWLSGMCRHMLRVMDVEWSTQGPVPMDGAVISNHKSYLDIVVHGALRPCVFVSAIETKKMPVIGWISMMAGTVYVVRGGGGSAEKAAEGMAKGFRDGLPVVFFPEGGTFAGDETVMPFHSGLLAQALEAGAPVTPGFIRYELTDRDLAAGRSTEKDVHWSTQTLLGHLWNFVGLHRVLAVVSFGDSQVTFSPSAYEDRRVAAEEARRAVVAVGEGAFQSLREGSEAQAANVRDGG